MSNLFNELLSAFSEIADMENDIELKQYIQDLIAAHSEITEEHKNKMEKNEIISLEKPDHSQIPIKKQDLLKELSNHESDISNNLLYCIYRGPDDPEYKIRLLAASLQAEHLARFVYHGKNGYQKLASRYYERKLFLDNCESVDEVKDCLVGIESEVKEAFDETNIKDEKQEPVVRIEGTKGKVLNEKDNKAENHVLGAETKSTIEKEQASEILYKYLLIKDMWVEAITFFYETPFASELGFAADYVITHDNLPQPEFADFMFPTNYPDFDYSLGIGKEFFGLQMGNITHHETLKNDVVGENLWHHGN